MFTGCFGSKQTATPQYILYYSKPYRQPDPGSPPVFGARAKRLIFKGNFAIICILDIQ
jgi:hypothetical protein